MLFLEDKFPVRDLEVPAFKTQVNFGSTGRRDCSVSFKKMTRVGFFAKIGGILSKN
jgi:hypothetical protein